jgi:hypothetical protein
MFRLNSTADGRFLLVLYGFEFELRRGVGEFTWMTRGSPRVVYSIWDPVKIERVASPARH